MHAEKELYKIQHPLFFSKPLSTLGIEGNLMYLTKNIYKKLTANILLGGEILNIL